MGLLDGGIASIVSATLSGLYLDATLHTGTGEPIYDDDTGAITGYTNAGDVACKAQDDAATDAMRRAEGYAEGDARILILAQGIGTVTSDFTITVRGQDWRLLSAQLDAAEACWDCRARRV
jgi:hypothetical protein